MALDRDEFIEHFLAELNDNIAVIDSGILILKNDPENEDELNRLLRALHTIKGSSRMLKFKRVEQLVHGLENVFKGVREKRYAISKPVVQLVFLTTDALRACAAGIEQNKEDAADIQPFLDVYEKVYANEPYSLRGLKPAQEAPAGDAEQRPPDQDRRRAALTGGGDAGHETVRIKIQRIDRIIKQLNDLIIKQFQFRKSNESLKRLERMVEDLAGAGDKDDPAGRRNECLKSIQKFRKDFAMDLTLLERDTFNLQEEILSLQMLPLNLILDPMRKMVAEMAMLLGKEIDFEISGADLMIDRMILEKLNDPLIHLIRNAVDHGIEPPERRAEKGKPRTGRISVACTPESGNIIIRITDDGRGLDYDDIRRKAVAMNPHHEEEIREMDRAGLSAYLFSSGFSTRDAVGDLSGRGVGLDIVRYNIEIIKGKISLHSVENAGAEFTLTMPLSLATVEGFFVMAAGEKFLFPSTFIKEVITIREKDAIDLLSRKAIQLRSRIIPIYQLSDILNKPAGAAGDKRFVIVAESLNDTIGIVVDTVLEYASLIYKPLPGNLLQLKMIQGIVFDESYNIINILYIPELMTRFKKIRSIDAAKRFSAKDREFKSVLVVDDSYTTREIEKSILELENYNVTTAVDGIDGLEKLRGGHFHLIVTDLKMPRMDGFTFIDNLKRDENFADIPVIVVTSHAEKSSRKAVLDKGVSAVIVKSDFERGNLLHEVRQLIG